ncbi:metalloregulator ArsR/SmtB family transcription factor [Rothia nasimurium]|uniref:ArsR/SmtB family transcription factor n=1 Tax=Rothia nasimurium TaxID=85336 RepID=UPI003BA34DDB
MKDDVFAVIADPTRRHILQALAVERLAVGELVEELGVSQPTVSKHLKVLRTAGLVETEAVGQKRFYSLTPAPLATVADWVSHLLQTDPAPSGLAQPAETAPEPITEEVSEASAEEVSESITEEVSEPVAEEVSEASAETAPGTSPEAPAEKAGQGEGASVQSAITFTPLTSFTPTVFTPDVLVEEDPAPEPAELAGPAEIAHKEVAATVQPATESPSEAEETEAAYELVHPEDLEPTREESEDRGLLAKFARWRRTNR